MSIVEGEVVVGAVVAGEVATRIGARNPIGVCHTRVLAAQLEARLCRAATWQGLRKRCEWPSGTPDLVVCDEIHVGDSPDWQQVFEMIPRGTPVLGLTATPWRFSHGVQVSSRRKNSRYGKGLGDLFGAMVVGVTPRQLVNDGYLVPMRVRNLIAEQDEAAIALGKEGPSWDPKRKKHTSRLGAGSDFRLDPVSAWLQCGEDRKTMVFCHMVASAEATRDRFLAAGVRAAVVHGGMSAKASAVILDAFKRNELKVLVNVMQLTAGVDVPDVSCIVLDRGCSTLNTYIQICGRGARPAPGKTDCLLLDLTGCTAEHGDPQKDQDYWITTCEDRKASDLTCGVCGTTLSPMFPTRCMRCDPFRPKVGAPLTLLDTGARVYCALKDLGPEPTDEAIVEAMAAIETSTPREREIAEAELTKAAARIKKRAVDTEFERRRAEIAEQARAYDAARAAEYRAEIERRKQAASGLLTTIMAACNQARAKGWGLGYGLKKVREQRFPDYQGSDYSFPQEILLACRMLPDEYRDYELARMLKDPRTNQYGNAWCRKKVRELLGESQTDHTLGEGK